MPTIRATQSLTIAAPAAVLYELVADYRNGHPRILPPQYFGRLDVLAGGRGAGTRIRFDMKAFGRTTTAEGTVTEPDPGRELRETLDSGIVSTFLVESLSRESSHVTITTTYEKAGVGGWIERLVVPGYLRRVYTAELALLAREAAARSAEHRTAGTHS
ncbi:MAG TPA: SRPBCC family protein [Verrucomicrobiae bacterium]|nr:SRPBCC family protein [Verrucomicrobiae bacterium]